MQSIARVPAFVRIESLQRRLSLGRRGTPLWWYPGWSLVAGIVLGAVLGRLGNVDVPGLSFLVYEGSASAARSFVELVATSLATVTTLTLTLTVVSIQLASSQYSPRLIEHYLDDGATHAVVSLFLGTFAFAIATLLSIGESGDLTGDDQVPGVAISLLIALVVLSLAAFVFFVHRVTTSMRVEAILRRVRDRTLRALGTRDPDDASDRSGDLPDPPSDATVVRSRRTGFYAAIDRERCRRFRSDDPIRVWLVVAPGDFVAEGTPVALIDGVADDDVIDSVERWLQFDEERWVESDVSYGARNLVDVALKGLSPGVNDPTTATMAIHRLGETMAAAGRSHPERTIVTEAGTRVYVAIRRWDDTLTDAVRQLAHYGRHDIEVVSALVRMLAALAWTPSEVDRRDVVAELGGCLRSWIEIDVTRSPEDVERIAAEFGRLDSALDHTIPDDQHHLL